ncbi:hypothetical protein BU17DRAFT_96908 [Hysterangium stoloniferum]|nr:hypothetical protein BU17DRAFT_96908 [Hysterangium stoloniferum]
MPPKAYSSFFFNLPNVPHSAPPVPPVDVYPKAQRQQQFRGKSFLSLDNADSIRGTPIGDEQEGDDEVPVDPHVQVDMDKESIWTAFTKSSIAPSSFVLAQGTYATRTRPVLTTLDTRHRHHHHHHYHQRPSPSPSTSSHSLSQPKLTPTSTVLPTPPVLPELPQTPSLALPFDFDLNSTPFSAPVTKTAYPTFHAPPPTAKATSVPPSAPLPIPPTTLPPTPPVSPSRSKPSPHGTPTAPPSAKSKPIPIPKAAASKQATPRKSKPKTSPQSTPLQPRPITAPQARRQRPLSTSTVSTHYRMVKRAGALACLEGNRDADAGVGGGGLGVRVGLVKSTVISAKSKSEELDVKSFMPLDDLSDEDDDGDDEDDVHVPVIGVRVRRQRHRGTIDSWYVGPGDGGKESRFSSTSHSPVSSRSTSPSPSSSSSVHRSYAHHSPLYSRRNVGINVAYDAASISEKSSPMLASMKPTGNFIDLDFEGEGDIYEYAYWR